MLQARRFRGAHVALGFIDIATSSPFGERDHGRVDHMLVQSHGAPGTRPGALEPTDRPWALALGAPVSGHRKSTDRRSGILCGSLCNTRGCRGTGHTGLPEFLVGVDCPASRYGRERDDGATQGPLCLAQEYDHRSRTGRIGVPVSEIRHRWERNDLRSHLHVGGESRRPDLFGRSACWTVIPGMDDRGTGARALGVIHG